MGDETKQTERRHGNRDPLQAARKPSSADFLDEMPSPVTGLAAGVPSGKSESGGGRTGTR